MKLSKSVDTLAIQAIRLWILDIERQKKQATGDTLTAKDVAKELETELVERGVTIANVWQEETPKPTEQS